MVHPVEIKVLEIKCKVEMSWCFKILKFNICSLLFKCWTTRNSCYRKLKCFLHRDMIVSMLSTLN